MTLLEKACQFVGKEEGCRLKPYLDTRGVPTIGYGNTYYEDGTRVTMKDPAISSERAMSLFSTVIQKFLSSVESAVKVSLSDNQMVALTSFAYNEGLHAFETSTLLSRLNQEDYDGAASEFLKWTRSGSDPQRLLARREREKELFLS